jgi:hypothetical protein
MKISYLMAGHFLEFLWTEFSSYANLISYDKPFLRFSLNKRGNRLRQNPPGEIVYDIARNFVLMWSHVLQDKKVSEKHKPTAALSASSALEAMRKAGKSLKDSARNRGKKTVVTMLGKDKFGKEKFGSSNANGNGSKKRSGSGDVSSRSDNKNGDSGVELSQMMSRKTGVNHDDVRIIMAGAKQTVVISGNGQKNSKENITGSKSGRSNSNPRATRSRDYRDRDDSPQTPQKSKTRKYSDDSDVNEEELHGWARIKRDWSGHRSKKKGEKGYRNGSQSSGSRKNSNSHTGRDNANGPNSNTVNSLLGLSNPLETTPDGKSGRKNNSTSENDHLRTPEQNRGRQGGPQSTPDSGKSTRSLLRSIKDKTKNGLRKLVHFGGEGRSPSPQRHLGITYY